MQELRLVAVSEDGTYLVLATAGRGTRFTLPVDDRLRAAVRGHFSRLGQFEIEVESPLRPKEIQARIRSGETAEEIAESAGIPVERVRWFEGPVLQEREYMAQQAQRVAVRRPGESAPGPPLGETVEERLGRGGVDLEEAEWDSWKCEDNTWRVRLSFFDNGRPHAAEWTFDPRRRHVSPLDEVAARLTAVEWDDEALSDTVTPLVPRRPAMKVVSNDRDRDLDRDLDLDRGRERDPAPRGLPAEFPAEVPAEPAQARPAARPAPSGRPEPLRAAEPREYAIERGRMVEPRPSVREPGEAAALHEAARPREADERAEPAARPSAAPAPAPLRPRVAEEPATPPEAVREAVREAAPPDDEPAAETDERPEAVADERADATEQATEEPETDEAEQHAEPVAEETSDTGEADESSGADEERPADEPEPEPEPEAVAEPEEADVAEPEPAAAKAPEAEPVAARPEPAPEPEREQDEPAPEKKPAAAQRPAQRQPARAPAKKKPAARPAMPAAQDKPATGSPAAAAAASGGDSAAAQRPARRRKAKGKRASVPSWDEIMFGARRPD
ncbi:septation protein SepH [Actinomadura decatromicini]|uniref:DUF3071 domain-containing protein n=1 Tax=Actinomadura decatromicini TaxID=2604572 RepID=A0A5D3FB25_9ACTN|nr:septation protein SepH [Actinomadura decatromicini]TYK46157.1 DUF3071 domain-containing protein [Actinomadura decatromicini]